MFLTKIKQNNVIVLSTSLGSRLLFWFGRKMVQLCVGYHLLYQTRTKLAALLQELTTHWIFYAVTNNSQFLIRRAAIGKWRYLDVYEKRMCSVWDKDFCNHAARKTMLYEVINFEDRSVE